MIGHLIWPEITELVANRDFATLKEVITDWPPADIAEILSNLPANELAIIFRLLPKKIAADVYQYLELDMQKKLLKAMAQEQVAAILNEMAPDDRTALFEELPPETVKQLIQQLSPQERRISQNLLGYPEGSVGRLMTPDYLAINKDWSVTDVLRHVREHGRDSETLNVLYVVDDAGKLRDAIRMREFLLSPLDKKTADFMHSNFVSLKATDDQETALATFRKHDGYALPVVDSEDNLIGIVTTDDVLDVADEEATEDIQKFGGLEAIPTPYLSTPLLEMVKKRSTWLLVLFLGELLTASAMAFFEREIARAIVLVLFVPLIISSGGNSGSQAATLIIRAMALEEVSLKDWFRVMKRELISGLILGALLGMVGFFRITLWSLFFNLYGPHWVMVAITVAVTLVGVVLWGTLAGSMLPFILKRLGLDPATSSAPFVATLVDVTGLIIYFTVAFFVLRGTLL
ncbi:MAG TPA: magnesium transporter [Acidobacteriota bacterium]|nr:magnesium transporter [Acidobacteriota bacterium]